ncbi:similar to Saccharomyces cerevisiae YBR259W Putative protein of unknown function [Maudiozyma barnettii]|uniref:Uncharacterized protein n=1 Tax=Maudiozyma barnettii TaxID=61262 RepID=A0A8H2VFA0_9SACH|nr:uncharacterized protein KABA2_04S08602 [Kazachstania barnettii]CAB4254539.1 similar to Saccharomyces cerevisiae YBR259W Putative protein of unknown function [Kazachstania barnettii]CAD1782581.1 similar to Saccharomyces cerevisiae YBR259W Putative protein of unknown function [Kazachstania barnettii]
MESNDYLLHIWTETVENLFFDEKSSNYFNHLKKLRYISVQLNNKYKFDEYIWNVVIDSISLIVKRYSNNLNADNLQGIENSLDIFNVFFDLKNEILIYFSKDKSILDNSTKKIEKIFCTNLNLNISMIWNVILLKILNYDNICSTHSSLLNYTRLITYIESLKSSNQEDVAVVSVEALELAINNIINSMIENNENCDSSFIIKILKIQQIRDKIYHIYQIDGDGIQPYLIKYLENDRNENVSLINLLKDSKLTDETLSILYRFYQIRRNSNQFLADMLKYRSVEFENNNWNELLNKIDLFDTFETKISSMYHEKYNKQFEKDTSLEVYKNKFNFKHSQMISVMNKNDTEDHPNIASKIIDQYRQALRNNFKASIENAQLFYESLLVVLDSYYDTTLESGSKCGFRIDFMSTTYALSMLVLNYTPDLELFIKCYYAPKLLKRMITYQNIWISEYSTLNSFDSILIDMLPNKIGRPLINMITQFVQTFKKPEPLEDTNCEFYGTYLKGAEYSFSLPTTKPLFPDCHLKSKWEKILSGPEGMSSGKSLDQSIHIIEMSSPFLDTIGNPVTLLLPINLASILFCFNKVDVRDISDIKRLLNVERSEENQIVFGLKALLKQKLLLKKNSTFKLNIVDIPVESLDKDGILRIL